MVLRVVPAVLAAALAGLSGCDLVGPDGCTLVGCASGLTVVLAAPPAGAFRIEVSVPGAAAAYVYDCPDPARCAPQGFFGEFTPEAATVTVTTARGRVQQEVRPRYTTRRPNGDDCPPVCRQGAVTVPLPT